MDLVEIILTYLQHRVIHYYPCISLLFTEHDMELFVRLTAHAGTPNIDRPVGRLPQKAFATKFAQGNSLCLPTGVRSVHSVTEIACNKQTASVFIIRRESGYLEKCEVNLIERRTHDYKINEHYLLKDSHLD
jgi:hypothetical protein